MTYPGFVGEEILISHQDIYVVAVISTWIKVEDWRAWEESTIRKELLSQAIELLLDKPRATVWRTMPTVRWVG